MLNRALNEFSIVTGALRSEEIGYVAMVKDDLIPDRVEHSFFLVHHKGNWLWPTTEDSRDWTTVGVAAVKQPLAQALFMGLFGQIFRVGSGDVSDEDALNTLADGPSSFGPMRCIRAIDGIAYAVGMGRQAYRRAGKNSWQRIDSGVRTPLEENDVYSFESIDGFKEDALFAAGRRGEIWSFDGKTWHREDSPTNMIITDIRCGASGCVYACGMNGTLLVRREGNWVLVETETVDDFWSVIEFVDRVFVATNSALFELTDAGVVPVDFGEDAPATCFVLTASGGLLWSIGAKNIFSFDGQRWSRVA